jgi:hypothetical protein
MKKVLFFAMVIALLVGGLAIAKLVDTPITPADLKDIKGSWTGERSGALGNLRTDLTISNDTLPLKGKITMYWQEGARRAPQTWPCTGQIENGRLKLFWNNKVGSADLGLRKADDGSMELKGTIVGGGFSAAVAFKKVK